MKKKIAIFGSTGSIGKTLINIIEEDINNFEIKLLTANKNYRTLLKQAKRFNVKNIIITDPSKFNLIKRDCDKLKIKVFNNFKKINKILKKRVDYSMCAISGINGLIPTVKAIKYSKTISIANKESIICAWEIINKELKKNKTNFVPVDSEHFSIWFAIRGQKLNNVEKFFITASGGPFYNYSLQKIKKAKISDALNHPNWKMGKKISIDSATLINKIYEVIEAKNIFNISYNKIGILIHPKSYIHAIIKYNNGLIKLIAHDTTMKIPIFNSIHFSESKSIKSQEINLNVLNNLSLKKVDQRKYPMVKLLNYLPNKHTLFETIIVAANDTLVSLYLKKKIKFSDIHKELFKIIKLKEFDKYKNISPSNIDQIIKLNNYVRFKIIKKVYKYFS